MNSTAYTKLVGGVNMRIGMRKPSLKKSLKARTTGRAKRALKKAVNPLYGRKGMGFIRNPKRSIKNRIYKRTTFSIWDILKKIK
ncbi:hypothetical protein HMPREF9244_01571 [Alloscardovia omnicolens F0580]|uniref:Phage protein n=2 Tax=Alloscardovia omnicolens TaxID=419015 RepID=U1R6Z1_9BIFI|nr:hypothetical protein HMPREF9244_01571 [Alloscardovia omnicolens F0580]